MNNVDDSLFISLSLFIHSEGGKAAKLQWIQGMTSEEMNRKLMTMMILSLSWKLALPLPLLQQQRSLTHFTYIVCEKRVFYIIFPVVFK